MKSDMSNEFQIQQVLELACAAQRVNGAYVKEAEWVFDSEEKPMFQKQTNKILMLVTLNPAIWTADPAHQPLPLKVTDEDKIQAEDVKKYFRKFMFGAIAGENEFQTEVNAILSSDTIKTNKFGFVACLPSVMERDLKRTVVKRSFNNCDNAVLADIDQKLVDLDCEIVEVKRSTNFDAWNINAVIDNKIVSWFSKTELKPGPCVVQKAKVKAHGENWVTKKIETRLNHVKAVH